MSAESSGELTVAASFASARWVPRRRRRWSAFSAAFLVVAGLAIYAATSFDGSTRSDPLSERTHRPAPGFSLPDLRSPGRMVSLEDLRGKDLVLNFWGSWCTPCQKEMPLLQSAYLAEHGKVRFVGIDSDDTRTSAVAFLSRVHVSYESLFDPTEQAASAYALYGLPTTVFISASGRMLGRHFGQFDRSSLQASLKEAFGTDG
jgi:cytochrome c biogenesis protein CcmG/thiol:disulfide interchange protein DsbE